MSGGVIVCPGVTIGDDTVVGAGVPARVLREITERDRIEVPER